MFNSKKTIPLMIFDFIMAILLFVFKPFIFLFKPTKTALFFVLKSIKVTVLFVLSIPFLLVRLLYHSFHWIALAAFIYIFGASAIYAFFGDGESNNQNNRPDSYYDDDGDSYDDAPKNPGIHWVDPYTRSDGTDVRGHFRSNPDGDRSNNLNSK